jgi:hypothetical protein
VIAKGVSRLFHAARWKAYLRDLQKEDAEVPAAGESEAVKSILQIYHSQKIWFTRDEDNGHQKAAEAHLKESISQLDECTAIVDNLEETLANTPKPSTVLDWSRLW